MKCPNCRTKVPKNYMYCPKCGLSVKAARASEQRRKNVILMGVLALNISACFLIFRCISLRKPASKPNVTAEISSQAETTAAPAAETTAPPETEAETEPATEETTVATTEKTTEKTTVTTEETTEKTTKTTTVTTEAPKQNDYFSTVGPMPFRTYDSGDPFLPPGIFTRADNTDGRALSEQNAKQIMMNLGVNWGKDFDLYCGDTEDEGGMTNSTYRYLTNAFPVPGTADCQLPAAVDLYVHNGDAAQGSYVRAVDYRFGNHSDYTGPYVFTREEIAGVFEKVAAYADGVYGGHAAIDDSNEAHYSYGDGALDIGYYQRDGKYVLWLARSND